MLPTSSRLCAVCLARGIGTSTSVFRTRQEAFSRPALLSLPRSDFRASPSVEDDASSVQQPESASSAAELAGRARVAAESGNRVECLALVWALKDLPRDASIREAIDSSCGEDSRSLLHVVVAARLVDSTELLLELGPSVGLKDEDGKTALHIAAEVKSKRLVRMLLCMGHAPVNARDALGRTPLHVAAEAGHPAVCRILMRFGANAKGADGQGLTPLDFDGRAEKTGGKEPRSVRALIRRCHHARAHSVRHVKEFARNMGPSPKANGHYKKGRLPHLVAPKLVLTPTGYCPVDEDGKVRQMPRGIRMAKSRQMPSDPKCHVNWYAPRG